MDEQWNAALDGLEAVWQRVSAQSAPAAPPPPADAEIRAAAGMLRGLLTQEAEKTAQYAAAARSAGGRTADALRALSRDCGRCLQTLRTEYYLLTGEEFSPQMPTPRRTALRACLRRAYLMEDAAARAYGEAAARAGSGRLRRMLAELAERSGVRREQVRSLLRSTLGK